MARTPIKTWAAARAGATRAAGQASPIQGQGPGRYGAGGKASSGLAEAAQGPGAKEAGGFDFNHPGVGVGDRISFKKADGTTLHGTIASFGIGGPLANVDGTAHRVTGSMVLAHNGKLTERGLKEGVGGTATPGGGTTRTYTGEPKITGSGVARMRQSSDLKAAEKSAHQEANRLSAHAEKVNTPEAHKAAADAANKAVAASKAVDSTKWTGAREEQARYHEKKAASLSGGAGGGGDQPRDDHGRFAGK